MSELIFAKGGVVRVALALYLSTSTIKLFQGPPYGTSEMNERTLPKQFDRLGLSEGFANYIVRCIDF